jgi:hypothetical protein
MQTTSVTGVGIGRVMLGRVLHQVLLAWHGWQDRDQKLVGHPRYSLEKEVVSGRVAARLEYRLSELMANGVKTCRAGQANAHI